MRLIDADAFLKRNEVYADCEFIHPMYQNTLREIVDDEPTIPTPRWVRCEDRLPDIAEKVLVYNRGQIFTAWRTSFSEPIGKWDSYDFQTDDITHWMPLPEPPKEDA